MEKKNGVMTELVRPAIIVPENRRQVFPFVVLKQNPHEALASLVPFNSSGKNVLFAHST